jgi:membrane peptidoglycan carboxypeptidase
MWTKVSPNAPPLTQQTTSAFPPAHTRLGRHFVALIARFTVALFEVAAGAVLGALVLYELQTSAWEAEQFSRWAARVQYAVVPGRSPQVAFPHGGPFDVRRGYSQLPIFQARLETRGFQVAHQAVVSSELATLLAWGISPPYPEPAATGLTIRGMDDTTLFNAVNSGRRFARFEDIPPLLVDALLFIENHELLTPFDPRCNPVIEWNRLAKAGLLFAGGKIGFSVPLQGGSTLATQLEKYRHSPSGRTGGAFEKLRQLIGATLKAYAGGPDTRAWRRQIVVDYLNTLPLAAAPGYGELYGLGDGLYAWFGLRLDDVRAALRSPEPTSDKLRAFKHALALIIAVRAPTTYLVESHAQLDRKVDDYVDLLARNGVIDDAFAAALTATPITFLSHAPVSPPVSFVQQKAPNAVRTALMRMLGVPSFYELDRLHLEVESPIDVPMEGQVAELFQQLADPRFVAANALKGEHLLRTGDPGKVIYSLMLFERTPQGNVLRVQADNLDRPFDINDGVKMELGSTAKLRTLAHYLELVAGLYHELGAFDVKALAAQARAARDPITKWAAETLQHHRHLDLAGFLQRALQRRYSASPYEGFFTGGGMHSFGNFDKDDNGRIVTVHDGLQRSVNLVFIRLMRDLVRYHEARLPYDAKAVLKDADHPERQRLLTTIAADEARHFLLKAYRTYHGLSPDEILDRLLGSRADSPRHLAIVFYAWHSGGDADALGRWLRRRVRVSDDEVARLARAYDNPRLTVSDYGYLLSRHPLDVWCAGQLVRQPGLTWKQVVGRSADVRATASAWLFKTRNRHAQNVRLRIRIERDAFARMTPYWQRLGFPFKRLVPSYATAIGNSSDRPAALAELMGIIVNDGVKRPTLRLTQLHFAAGTPYETVFEPAPVAGAQVMEPEVARALRGVLADVVSGGTARRVAGAFVHQGKPLVVGGKTGSGDNRFKTFRRHGGVISARPVNRTATFVFYIGDRYYGVLTAFVPGRQAGDYEFTSALPVSVLRLAAPMINPRL